MSLINIPNSPFVHPKTGVVNPEWLQWLQNPNFVSFKLSNAIPVQTGGTGNVQPLTDGQILIGVTALPSQLVPGNITGTVNQIYVANGPGSITLSAAQDIAVTSTPIFAKLSLNDNAVLFNPSENGLFILQQDSINSAVEVLAFSAHPILKVTSGNGTADIPTQLTAGNLIFTLSAYGYDDLGAPTNSSTCEMEISAAETYTTTNQGTKLKISNTALGTSFKQQVLAVSEYNHVIIGNAADDTVNIFQVWGGQSFFQGLVTAGSVTVASGLMISGNAGFTDYAGAAAGTLLNSPVAGNPSKWIGINDNGTTRYIPAW